MDRRGVRRTEPKKTLTRVWSMAMRTKHAGFPCAICTVVSVVCASGMCYMVDSLAVGFGMFRCITPGGRGRNE